MLLVSLIFLSSQIITHILKKKSVGSNDGLSCRCCPSSKLISAPQQVFGGGCPLWYKYGQWAPASSLPPPAPPWQTFSASDQWAQSGTPMSPLYHSPLPRLRGLRARHLLVIFYYVLLWILKTQQLGRWLCYRRGSRLEQGAKERYFSGLREQGRRTWYFWRRKKGGPPDCRLSSWSKQEKDSLMRTHDAAPPARMALLRETQGM